MIKCRHFIANAVSLSLKSVKIITHKRKFVQTGGSGVRYRASSELNGSAIANREYYLRFK